MKYKYWSFTNFFGRSSGTIDPPEEDEIYVFINRVESDGGIVENESGLESLVQSLKNIE